MSIVTDIIAKLNDIDPPVFSLVGGAGDFAQLDGAVPTAMPAAYVMVLQDASGDNERMTGPVLQRTEADIGVVLITQNVSDHVGGAAAGDIESLKTETRGALVGFVPDGAVEPMTHISGQIVKVKGGAVWHEETFSAVWLTKEQT